MRTVTIITGASGSVFGVELLKRLAPERFAIVTHWGEKVLREETGLGAPDVAGLCDGIFPDDDLASPLSSGSNSVDTVIVLPASASFVAKVATGLGDTLATRLCHVALKERRRLVICPRESPGTGIFFDNCARLVREGAIVMPVSPTFYLRPKTLEELVGQFVDRVLQAAGGKPPADGWRREDLP